MIDSGIITSLVKAKFANFKQKSDDLKDLVIKYLPEDSQTHQASTFKFEHSFDPLTVNITEISDTLVKSLTDTLIKYKPEQSTHLYFYVNDEFYVNQCLRSERVTQIKDSYFSIYSYFNVELNPPPFKMTLVVRCKYDILNEEVLNQKPIQIASHVHIIDGKEEIIPKYLG